VTVTSDVELKLYYEFAPLEIQNIDGVFGSEKGQFVSSLKFSEFANIYDKLKPSESSVI
jgi:hypothetical protein